MHRLIRRHHISFKNAWNGIVWAFTTQPNFLVHVILATFAILGGVYFQISITEMTILVLTIVFGLGVEMVNTAIESMTDLITTQWKQQAKIAKDVAAGMMLLTAVGAVIVASLIFLPRIYKLLFL